MREYLFRGKTYDGEWIEGFYVCNRYSVGFAKEPAIYENHYIYTKRNDGEKWFKTIQVEVIPETVGQFTGLTDKNGKKIFEGDIVAYNELYIDGKEYQEIGYFECDKDFVSFRIHGKNMTPFYCEVIGNIHDNPELLGE